MKKKTSNLYYKNLKMFLLTILIPILILGTFSFTLIFNYIQNNARSKTILSVEQMGQNIDLIADNVITLRENFSTDANPTMSLKRILQSDQLTYANSLKLSMFKSILNATINFRDYIHSIYVYFPNPYHRFLVSRQGIMNLDNYPDTGWLLMGNNLSDDTEHTFDSQFRQVNQGDLSGSTDVLTLYQKPFSIDYKHAEGMIVLNLKYKYLENLLDNLITIDNQKLYLFNSRQELLVKSSSACEQVPPEVYPLLSKATVQPLVNSKKGYTISISKSTNYDFIYVSVVSDKDLYAIPRLLLLFIIILILISLFAALALANRYSKKSQTYIDHIVHIINAAKNETPFPESLNPTDDEYNYIITNLLETFFKQHYLSVQLSEKNYKAKTLELTALQAQINPHFLSNTLETIHLRAFALTREPNAVTYLIENLSDILRYSLTNPTSMVRFEDDLEYTKCYLNIQQFRYKDKFRMIWNCTSDLNNIFVPKLLLQPLIENSIYHGLKEKKGNGIIKIRCFLKGQILNIHVIDNGKGIEKEHLALLNQALDSEDENFEHIGLCNTYKRLKIVYGKKLNFSIRSKYQVGTAIYLSIPIEF